MTEEKKFDPFTMPECELWLTNTKMPFEFHVKVFDGLVAQEAADLVANLKPSVVLATAKDEEGGLLDVGNHALAEEMEGIADKVSALTSPEGALTPAIVGAIAKRICDELTLDNATLLAARWMRDVYDETDGEPSSIQLRRAVIAQLEHESYDIVQGNKWLAHMSYVMYRREAGDAARDWNSWREDADYDKAVGDGIKHLLAWQKSLAGELPSALPKDEEDDEEDDTDPLGDGSQPTTSAMTPGQDMPSSEITSASEVMIGPV